ncbi:MAG: lipoyl(octanoyl) transferase LipB [Armatimonadota bacterium]|nr:lipoyl(octanoyl) transferase LipB [Armatimonadota bacterium]
MSDIASNISTDKKTICSLHSPGRQAYADALELQLSLVDKCQKGDIDAALIVLEHDPVITMGAGAKDCNLLLPKSKLNELGVTLFKTDRGGDVTYHGPGQIVAYPILNLRTLGLDVHTYLRKLEDVVIDTLSDYGLEGIRHGQAGVWVGEKKVCSIGIAVRRSVTYHGLALNVAPNMAHFSYINPCGLEAARITCFAELLDTQPDMGEVASKLRGNFAAVFNVRFVEGVEEVEGVRCFGL